MTQYLIVDGNSIGFAAHESAKLKAGTRPTQAIFGTLRILRAIMQENPHAKLTVVWDGKSWREGHFPAYKKHRDDNPKQKASRDSYREQRPHIARALALLGVPQLVAGNLEADDLAGLLVRKWAGKGNEIQLITADKDWLQLVQAGVEWHDRVHNIKINPSNFAEKTGYAAPRAFLEAKALIGDSGDFGPGSGVPGIGAKGAQKLLAEYGSVKDFLVLARSKDRPKLPKPLAAFADDPAKIKTYAFYLKLMDLSGEQVPKAENLRLIKHPMNIEGFRLLCGEFYFSSILADIQTWVKPFKEKSA